MVTFVSPATSRDPMSYLLEALHVGKVYGHHPALEDLSLAIDTSRPAITAVVGESGSGKTTLARMLLGLSDPSSGKVLYRGRDLQRLSGEERRAFLGDVQAVFQDPYEVYNPFYRVDNVLTTPVRKFKLARTKAEGRALIEAALRDVGLRPEEILGRFPHQLSGGQRQRIMVARALLLRPKLIVADEPVSMVDASLRATILGSLRKLNEEMGISIIYITHDLATAYQVSHNILVMYRSRIVEAGAIERVVKHPQHPYTQLLINAIPKVSTTRDWLGTQEAALAHAGKATGHAGKATGHAGKSTGASCRFADRCPSAMPGCLTAQPPLFRTEPTRAVACLLYDTSATLAPEAMGDVLGASSVQPFVVP